jgi:hypothetical protein
MGGACWLFVVMFHLERCKMTKRERKELVLMKAIKDKEAEEAKEPETSA